MAQYLLAAHLGQQRGTLSQDEVGRWMDQLVRLPGLVEEALGLKDDIRKLAEGLAAAEHTFFIGRGLDRATAMEGALKLKEISYIHAEAYAAGELKHGTLALITEGTPVVALATQRPLLDKVLSNVKEVKARVARVMAVAAPQAREVAEAADTTVWLPDAPDLLMPVVAAVPLQLLAYDPACLRGCDVDKPRNLAKSVTVE